MNQEPVITVWKDGTWKLWGAMDAEYAKADLDYLVTIAVREVTGVASPTLLGFPVVEVDDFPSIKGITFGKPLL